MREISKLLAVRSVPFLLYGKGRPNACSLSSSLVSKGEKLTPSQPSLFSLKGATLLFSVLTVWALRVARKDFKVENHPLLPRISLVLLALQFSNYYVYERALH